MRQFGEVADAIAVRDAPAGIGRRAAALASFRSVAAKPQGASGQSSLPRPSRARARHPTCQASSGWSRTTGRFAAHASSPNTWPAFFMMR